ncbi:MAG TPA: endopeptidase La [Kofleriaceae bacterium]|nr:endopeptidase La [Kofleriaceae bacterium]
MSDSTQHADRPLPILTTRKEVVLPGVVTPLEVGRRASIAAVDAAMAEGSTILLVPQLDPRTDVPKATDLCDVGVVAEIVQIARHSATRYTAIVRTGARVHLDKVESAGSYLVAHTSSMATVVPPDVEEADALVERTRRALAAILAEQADTSAENVRDGLDEVEDPDDLADMAAAHVQLERDELIALLREPDVVARLRMVLPALERLGQVLQMKGDIREQLVEEMSKEERERVLRQRMKAINEQLGEQDDEGELTAYLERIDQKKMSEEARKAALKQVRKMRQAGQSSPEHNVARTYLEWLLDLPWGETTVDTLDVPAARAILEADHAGLEKVKKRILEFIAVRKLAPDKHGPILCLVGPPGVGKTSLGRSIAAALGRKYVRASLGGVRDDAEIRGHRRTYVGALPGRIVNGLKKAGSMNPVFVLDEIDKLSNSMRGDPASALLEVLDPEQNREFVDHYLEVAVDLSQVMFLATANSLETIPGPLLDRMEIIQIPGYTEREKLAIARRHLLPKQVAEHGIEREKLEVADDALMEVIRHYTREAGVRNLEREIATLCRSAAVDLAAGERAPARVTIGTGEVAEILGPPRFFSEVADQAPSIGVATGLGWMPTGGDLLFIETRHMPGKGDVKLTGQVGDVMEESARAALSWVRSHADGLGIPASRFAENDIHVHVPSGAVKKDGPSAGVALATALVSLMSEIPVRSDVAMTGEVTLRGLVLPVGGIKSKVLAAHRAGIRTVILPERNRNDMADIPEEVQRDLDVVFVTRIGEALDVALASGETVPIATDAHPPVVPRVPPEAPSRRDAAS